MRPTTRIRRFAANRLAVVSPQRRLRTITAGASDCVAKILMERRHRERLELGLNRESDRLSRLDSLIESAPEVSEPPPWEAPAPVQASPEPAKETPAAKEAKPAADDSFYRDPLIEQALVLFEGKVVG